MTSLSSVAMTVIILTGIYIIWACALRPRWLIGYSVLAIYHYSILFYSGYCILCRRFMQFLVKFPTSLQIKKNHIYSHILQKHIHISMGCQLGISQQRWVNILQIYNEHLRMYSYLLWFPWQCKIWENAILKCNWFSEIT